MTRTPSDSSVDDERDPAWLDELIESCARLPTLAPVAVRVIELIDDESVSMDQLIAVIGADPGLAARLMQLVNSAAYSPGVQVTSLKRAAVLLGLRALKVATLGFSLVGTLGSDRLGSTLIWRRSLATGILARRLASSVGSNLAEDAFLAGLLMHVGKLVLLDRAEYKQLVRAEGPWLTADEELDQLGFTTYSISSQVLANWGLPKSICDAIGCEPGSSPAATTAELRAFLEVADLASILLLADDVDRQAGALDLVATAAGANFAMTLRDVERVIETARPELNEMAGSFDFDAIATTSIAEIVNTAQARLARLSIDMAMALATEELRNQELSETSQQLAAAAATDPLTRLANRRAFDECLAGHVATRIRNPRPSMLGLLIFDLDHFKAINDQHGHAVGDEVLRAIGGRLLSSCRDGELMARIGGEEFALVIPDADVKDVMGAAERIRSLIGEQPIATSAGPIAVTVSIGGSCADGARPSMAQLLFGAADAALYAAKQTGRNTSTVTTIP